VIADIARDRKNKIYRGDAEKNGAGDRVIW